MPNRMTMRSVESLGTGRHSDGTGIGLMLWVSDSGSRSWVQRLRVNGRRRDLGLGPYPLISLAEARDLAHANKKAVLQGRDPFAEKKRRKEEAARRLTFAEAAVRTRDELASTWRGKKEPQAFLSSLKTYAFPYFGNISIEEVTSADIRRAVLAGRKSDHTESDPHALFELDGAARADVGDDLASGQVFDLDLQRRNRRTLVAPGAL